MRTPLSSYKKTLTFWCEIPPVVALAGPGQIILPCMTYGLYIPHPYARQNKITCAALVLYKLPAAGQCSMKIC